MPLHYKSSPKPDPTNPGKQLHLVLDYCLLNKSINTANTGNKVLSYYPLPNITDLLERLQNCKIFSSLDLRSGYHHNVLTTEAIPKNSLCHYKWKVALEHGTVWNLLFTRCILLSNVTSVVRFRLLCHIP